MKNKLTSLLAEGKTQQALAELRKLDLPDPDLQQMIVQNAARFAALERQTHAGTLSFDEANRERNKINAALMAVVEQLPEGMNISFPEDNIPAMVQTKPSGSGDYVAGNKIGRQINMGAGSTYNEHKKSDVKKEEPSKKEPTTHPSQSEPQNLPETTSGVIGVLLGWLPKPLRPIIAIVLLGLGTYGAYHYFLPKKEEANKVEATIPDIAPEKVFVSGIIRINNGEPKPNEIKRMNLRDVDANPARIDGTGRFTFSNVKIPANKRLLVDVTFFDGKTVPTQELIVGDVDKETMTVRLPDLYAERPRLATKNSPAKNWSINIVHSGVGDNNIQIQK